ncbi:MAG: YncE family protein [Candidatus Eremiobacteraeota bacterium]|nr:YncE family protein [Candidatus Eremiobacteraeota bacterium]
MPLLVAAPPQAVPAFGGFDYVTVDEGHHRAYAAHTRSDRLLIVDTSTGKVAGQVDVGPMHGIAFDSAGDFALTGNGTDDTLSKVDPVAMKVLASVDVPGHVDAIAYDPAHKRIYADQDGGGNVYVVDAATMKQVGTIAMPSDDLESPAVDPKTGTLYQNLANGGGYAVVDGATMKVLKVVKTPQLQDNHPLLFASSTDQVIVGGINGMLSAYSTDGMHQGDVSVQPHIDQCSTGSKGKLIACAGRGIVTVLSATKGGAPKLLAKLDTGHAGIHTVGIDETTNDLWVVWSDPKGDWVQRLKWTP